MKKESDPSNDGANKPTLRSWKIEDIEEYFRNIGIPIKNVTEERAGTTTIIVPFSRPSKKTKDDKTNEEGRGS